MPNVNKRENRATLCLYSSRLCYLVQPRMHVASTSRAIRIESPRRGAGVRFDDTGANLFSRFLVLFFLVFLLHEFRTHSQRIERRYLHGRARVLISKIFPSAFFRPG